MNARTRHTLLAASALAALPVQAQESDPPPIYIEARPGVPETLGQAIADAYRSNPQLEGQRAQLRALDEQIVQAASPYRLNANLDLALQYRSQEQRGLLGEFDTLRSRTMGASVTVSQILLNGGRTAAQVSAAEASVLAGRERLREAENSILYEVVDAYVSVRRDQALVAIQQRSLASYGRQLTQAIARERGGDLTRTDIAQARAQREIVRAQAAQAAANLQASRARFATVVGRNPGNLALPPTLPGLPASLDAAFAIVEQESPSLWQAIMATKAGDARIAAQRAERAPIVALSGSYGYASPYSYQLRDAGPQVTGGVTVRVPLLSGGVIGSRIRAAVAERQQLGFEVETARRAALAEAQNAWNQAVAADSQMDSGREATEAAEAALTGVQRGFAEGFRSNFEVLDSEQRLLTAQVVFVNATYAAYAAQARLLATLGRLQAAAIDRDVPAYDPARNTRRVKAQTFGPFDPILAPIDRAQVPSGRARPAPVLAPAVDARVRPAVVQTLPGPMGGALPIVPVLRGPVATDLSDTVVTGGS
ncbi:TolC family outer membrane protein [Sphingomonas sp. RP10(2022)]|uniref:TolC family outer membrane protein n=1 Tax=Sphingomonas liriopis TaxID=2949094 RepID=A0A9X2HT93_9SPHN|nr:TolC family outer membrane protein [Sphingomonas liriopis]MCP3733941.1 TolC family outer membrane protein [Sphingomonas liriopis]